MFQPAEHDTMTNEKGVPEMGGEMRRSSSIRQDEKRTVLSFKVQGLVASMLLVLALLGAPATTAQTLDDAVSAWKRGDYAAAIETFSVFVEQGSALAQFRLGVMYEEGQGVPQDDGEAVRWYRLAAEQGNALAQGWIGYMYEEGRGVPQDDVQAHKWYNLAASRISSSDQRRDRVVKARNRVGRKMTRTQLAEAQRLSREWRPKPSTAQDVPDR